MQANRRSRVVLWICLAVLVVLGTWAIAFLPPANELRELEAKLASAAKEVGVGGEVRLEDVAPFAWDRVYVFGPYTPLDVVEQQLGFPWAPMSRVQALLSGDLFLAGDGLGLIVFLRRDQEVAGYRVTSAYQEPGVALDGMFGEMAREGAGFTVIAGAGAKWLLAPLIE